MGKYISQTDLAVALSPDTFVKLFNDDPTTDQLNQMAIDDVIDRAEGEVDSFLIGVNDVSKLNRFDRELRTAALDFARCFSFERRPEYERTFGEFPRGRELYKRATQRMQRVQQAAQELPDQQQRPKNVGGIVRDDGPRTIVTGIHGEQNGSGF